MQKVAFRLLKGGKEQISGGVHFPSSYNIPSAGLLAYNRLGVSASFTLVTTYPTGLHHLARARNPAISSDGHSGCWLKIFRSIRGYLHGR